MTLPCSLPDSDIVPVWTESDSWNTIVDFRSVSAAKSSIPSREISDNKKPDARNLRDKSLIGFADKQSALLKLSRVAISGAELSTVLTELACAGLCTIGADGCLIELWDPERDELFVTISAVADNGPLEFPVGARFQLSEWSTARKALEERYLLRLSKSDPTLSSGELEIVRHLGMSSGLFVPMVADDICFGAIAIYSRTEPYFSDQSIAIAHELSDQAALAISNDRRVSALRAKAEIQATLRRVSQAATSNLDLETTIGDIAEAALGLAGCESVAVDTWDRETDELVTLANRKVPGWIPKGAVGSRYRLSGWPTIRAVLAGQSPRHFRIDDSDIDDVERAGFECFGIRSGLILPITVGSETIGVVTMMARHYDACTSRDLAIALDVAGTMSLAVENAHLLANLQRQAAEQAALLRVSRAAISGGNLTEVLSEVARASLGIQGVEGCSIEHWHPETDDTEMLAEEFPLVYPSGYPTGERYSLDDWPGTRRVIESRRMLNQICPDDPRDPNWIGDYKSYSTNSVLIVPLLIGSDCLGTLELYSRKAIRFTTEAERFGFDLGVHAAQAIKRWQMQTELVARAETDGLTSLLNRRAIVEALETELVRATRLERPCSILLIDLDEFKEVNDCHGHLIGDRVLELVAATLRTAVRAVDRVGRYGGDEFLVVVPETDANAIASMASRVGDAIKAITKDLSEPAISLGFSIGSATYPDDGTASAELMAAADARMYLAKRMRRIPDVALF